MRRVRCTVEAMNYSACGLAVGDFFEVGPEGVSLPDGASFCWFAIAAVASQLGGRLERSGPDPWLAGRPLLACPDPPENLLLRIEEVEADA